MKKIFTLLLSTIFVSAAFAQYDNGNWGRNNDYSYHDRDRLNNNFFYYNNNRYCFDQRDEVIHQIDADYDFKIQRVADDWDMNPWRKRRIIENLKDQKMRDINSIYAQCNMTTYHDGGWEYHRHHRDGDDD